MVSETGPTRFTNDEGGKKVSSAQVFQKEVLILIRWVARTGWLDEMNFSGCVFITAKKTMTKRGNSMKWYLQEGRGMQNAYCTI